MPFSWIRGSRTRLTPSTRKSRRRPGYRPLLEALEERWVPSAVTVTSTADTEDRGTLRYAIEQVNLGNATEIDFAIGTNAQGGPATIHVGSSDGTALPAIMKPVMINGFTQGTAPNGGLLIQLDGTAVTGPGSGLDFEGGHSVVEGLAIGNFARGAGIVLGGTGGDQVSGNYLGADLGGARAQANAVGIVVASNDNTIGGPTAGARNVIAGNLQDGVLISGGVSGNVVQGNFIGADVRGANDLANGGAGVEVLGSDNTLGGNLISGNTLDGVLLGSDAAGNRVLGNLIGADVTGTRPLPNGGNGVEIAGAHNTVGGPTAGEGNVISGNALNGVLIVTGKLAVPNLGNGVEVAADNAVVGGTTLGAGNVISGNLQNGVAIDAGVAGVRVQGNFIGADVNGVAALPNVSNGVEVAGDPEGSVRTPGASPASVVIGGTTVGARNVISGNAGDGVFIEAGASGVQVQGNYVGTDVSGTRSLANGNGVEVAGSFNAVGGASAAARNVISGNTFAGVLLDGGVNRVQGNFIGVASSGAGPLPNLNGVEVAGDKNTIGGRTVWARNVISGNAADGVLILKEASGTLIQGNFIGTDNTGARALGNAANGVAVFGSHNAVGGTGAGAGNVIAFNRQHGVAVPGAADVIQHNSIFANGPSQKGPGIVVPGWVHARAGLSSATVNRAQHVLTVTGTVPGESLEVITLEFFANPVGDKEGKVYLGSTTVAIPKNGSSVDFTAVLRLTNPAFSSSTPLITVTETLASGETSAFLGGITATGFRPTAGATVSCADTEDWGTGFTGYITMTNRGSSAISGWTLQFDFAGTITDIWDAQIVSHVGAHYVVSNASWDATIAPGMSVNFGFNADWGDSHTAPGHFVLNGVPSGGG